MSAPVIQDSVSALRFPPYRVLRLSGGVKVYLVHDDSQELVSMSVIAKAGSTQEHVEGQASMSAAMLSRGSVRHSPTVFAENVDRLGASVRSMGHRDTTGVAFTGLGSHTDALIRLVAECVHEPAFDPDEFERLRFQMMSDHEYSLSDPQYLAHRAFAKTLYGQHPYAASRNGTLESLASLSAEQCESFYSALRDSSEWFIVVVGNFSENSIENSLEESFGRLRSALSPRTPIAPAEHKTLSCSYAAYESARQVIVNVGQLCIDRHHADYPGLQFLNTILGGYFLSRLNSIIREEKGFSYGVHSSLDSMFHASRFAAGCSVSAENLRETLSILRGEWTRLASEKISEEELRRCKRFILGSFARSMETPQEVAQAIGTAEEAGLEPEYYAEFAKRIAELSAEDLLGVQQRCVHPRQLVISASGRESDLRTILEEQGPTQSLVIL